MRICIVGNRYIMTIIEAILLMILLQLFVCRCIIHIVLRLLKHCRVPNLYNLRLSWHSFWIRVFAVRAHVHVIIVLLFQRWPSFFPDQRVVVLVFGWVILEERLGSRGLRLIMMGADVTTYVLALVKIAVMHIFLHAFGTHMDWWAHDDSCPTGLIGVVQDVGIGDILRMNASATLDHR